MELLNLIQQLKADGQEHEDVGGCLSDAQIKAFEKRTGFNVPPSFTTFLKEFGDGAYWLYGIQPIASTATPFWLKEAQQNTPLQIPVDGDTPVGRDSLFCLMIEDSNGGSWVWFTEERDAAGECPVGYYEPSQKKIFYKLQTFTKWLQVLVQEKGEVIWTLDFEERKCGLG